MAIGKFNNRLHTVIFQRLGAEAIAVISMRRASKKERALYERDKDA